MILTPKTKILTYKLHTKRKEIMTLDDIKIGSKWERLKAHGTGKIGEIITVTKRTKYIHYSDNRSLPIEDFLERFRPLAKVEEEKAEEEKPKAFYKESGKPWTRKELYKLSTYLGIATIKPSDFKLDRKYIYNDKNDGYFPWVLQHPSKVKDTYDRISYESIFEPKEGYLTSLDLTTAADSVTMTENLYDTNACSIVASNVCPGWIPNQHIASAPTATTNQLKGNMMNSTDIKIEVNGKPIDLCPETKAIKVKTDLKARKKYTVVIFNVDGSYSETLYFNAKNEDKAIVKMTKILQNPANIGKTATLHREIEVLTTEIPVVKADV